MIWPDDMNMPPFSGDDHHAEAHRLLDTGASEVDIGHGAVGGALDSGRQ
jgi:hypothetical protein